MINSGNDVGQHRPGPNIPPPHFPLPGIATIYSSVTVQGTKYRDFSASRREARARFNRRLLLKQRVEASRKTRDQAASAQAAVFSQPAVASEDAGLPTEAVDEAVQTSDPSSDAQRNPEAAQTPDRAEIAKSAPAIREEATSPSVRIPLVEHTRDEETPPFAAPALSGQGEIVVSEHTAAFEDPGPNENEVVVSKNEARSQIEADELEAVQAASESDEAAAGDAPAKGLRDGAATLGSRWFALRSVFAGDAERLPVVRLSRRPAPGLAIFSQVGGVGKTSLTATLGRVLAARGEQAFLAETTFPGLLPLFFGSREGKPGMVRTFSPPAGSDDAAVRAVTLDPQLFFEKKDAPGLLAEALLQYARGSNRILIDIQTASKTLVQRLLPVVSMVLVPLLADMNSVMSLDAVEAVFADRKKADRGESGSHAPEPLYLLNQFDGALPLHVEVRGRLQELLGDRLLPFVMRRSAAVSEALAEGMTVVDYAPDSSVAEDYLRLADWLASASPVAASGFSGLRWSER